MRTMSCSNIYGGSTIWIARIKPLSDFQPAGTRLLRFEDVMPGNPV